MKSRLKSNVIKCASLQLEKLKGPCIFFLIIYFLIVLTALILDYFLGNTSSVQTLNVFFPCLIFLFFGLSSSFKENFNHLLMMSNTRKNIVVSSFITITVAALSFAVISVLMQLLNIAVSKILNISQTDVIQIMYKNTNFLPEFLWAFAVLLLINSFSLLYGVLHYKFGKMFVLVFWVLFGLAWTFLPVIIGSKLSVLFITAFTMYFSAGTEYGIYFSAMNFIITAILFGCATYLIARKQEQRA